LSLLFRFFVTSFDQEGDIIRTNFYYLFKGLAKLIENRSIIPLLIAGKYERTKQIFTVQCVKEAIISAALGLIV
jgi:hypothetical protein